MTTILSLDASTTAVGWALFEDADLARSSVFVPDARLPWWARVRSIGRWLESFEVYPLAVAYEVASGRHGNLHTDRVLGAVHYVARVYAASVLAEFVEVYPPQVKATGVHKGDLEMARQFKRAPLHAKYPGDEADALGVGIAAWGIVKAKGWEALEVRQ